MNRKVNLAKLAKDGIAKADKNGMTSQKLPVKPVEIKSESPYFSPISHRTRNKQLQKLPQMGELAEKKPVTTVVKIEKVEKSGKEANSRKHIKIEYEEPSSSSNSTKPSSTSNSAEAATNASDAKASSDKNMIKPTKRSSGNERSIKSESSEKQLKWEPVKWQQIYDNIKKMRADRSAPVDTMGCHKCSDLDSPENVQRYQHLIALMLSSQTKDAVTYDAMARLKEYGLTPQKMVDIKDSELEKLLHPVSFYKTKAKHIKQTAKILIDSYESDIPNTIKDLVKLPGVGPKMAHILMRVAWGIVTGIGVDTHVHRIANRLKWVKKETKTPEDTRIALESWLPFDLWWEINELLVGFGQNTCKPVHPLCGQCLNCDICPSSQAK